MIKIIVDAFGGDNAPEAVISGAIKAVNEDSEIKICLVGQTEKINKILLERNYAGNRIEIIEADEVITNEEVPTEAIRTKKNSSLVIGLEKLNTDQDAVGFLSAGSTGAVLAGGFLKTGRIKGVVRPGLAPIIPSTEGGRVLLMDSGANMDCDSAILKGFAVMGSIYMKKMYNINNPRVALLNVGTEDGKGNKVAKEAFDELKKAPINFIGNMEAREFLSGYTDVVVADGYWGNILLKSTEGAILNLMKIMKREILSSMRGKIGGAILKPTFKKLNNTLDYNKCGGAVLLGVKKLIVKLHGSSTEETFVAGIMQVRDMAKVNITGEIENYFQNNQE